VRILLGKAQEETMRAKRLGLYASLLVGAVVAACGPASEVSPGQMLREATVTLMPGHCAGVIVEDGRHVMTAAHCITPGTQRMDVELFDGTQMGSTFVLLDQERDVSLFRLEVVAPVMALPIAPELPKPGDGLLFGGRNDALGEPQQVWLEKLGRCPSLPGVPQALFTTLRGRKGDSGAPVVDLGLQVVGLVHGGARCSIAAPTAEFAPVVRQLAEELRASETQGQDLAQRR
jgi:S1-C subfamily serine protease